MQLQEKLDKYRTGFEKKAPPEALAVMHRATRDLQASGAADRALGVGDRLPPVRLDNQDGVAVDLAEVLARGPLVLGFYRGRW